MKNCTKAENCVNGIPALVGHGFAISAIVSKTPTGVSSVACAIS